MGPCGPSGGPSAALDAALPTTFRAGGAIVLQDIDIIDISGTRRSPFMGMGIAKCCI